MLTSVQGVYRKGRIELEQKPENISDETRVIVTFLASGAAVDLRQRGITKAQAKVLRARLESFAEDWDSPEMSAYDDYDTAKSRT